MKSVLVTGGLGYIGSHLSLRLLEEGYKVFVIDSLVNSSYETLNKIHSLISLEKKAPGRTFWRLGALPSVRQNRAGCGVNFQLVF